MTLFSMTLLSAFLGIVLTAASAQAEIVTVLARCDFSAVSTFAGTDANLQISYTYLSIAGIPNDDPRQWRYDLVLSDSHGPFSRATVHPSPSGHTYSDDRVSLSIDPTRLDSQGRILAVYADTRSSGAVVADPAMTCTLYK